MRMLVSLSVCLALLWLTCSVYGQDEGTALLKELEDLQKSPNFGAVAPLIATNYHKKTTDLRTAGPSSSGWDLLILLTGGPKNCCNITPPPKTESQTRIVSYTCTLTYTEVYYTKCCFLNLGRRRKTRIGYQTGVCYKIETYYVSVPQPCPEQNKVCCPGELSLPQGCVSLDDLKKLVDLIKTLCQLLGCGNPIGM